MECERVAERLSLTSEFILVLWACSIHLFLGSTEVYLPREQPAYVTRAERVAFIYFWGLRRSIFLVNRFPPWSNALRFLGLCFDIDLFLDIEIHILSRQPWWFAENLCSAN